MGRNVEIKAKAKNPGRQHEMAKSISHTPVEVLNQIDTFYPVPQGRLKLRQLGPDRGELIHYSRSDVEGPKESNYSIFYTEKPDDLGSFLEGALSILGVVRKTRYLYLVEQTRIHVDEVEGLGWFLELEVVLEAGQRVEDGERIARKIMKQLEIGEEDLIPCAYIDLLLNRGS